MTSDKYPQEKLKIFKILKTNFKLLEIVGRIFTVYLN